MMHRITVRTCFRRVAIPTKPAYRELDPETRKLYQVLKTLVYTSVFIFIRN